ncbi:MAG: hypothetical protein LBC86_05910 [Oscillospiraceae bacterium]|jgi:ribosomal protein L40E|nr:hypothetical protein [Oscillospiraceae bacterium]
MNFWAKFLNIATNILIGAGVLASVIIGLMIMNEGGLSILFGFSVIIVGPLLILEAVALTKIIIYASEDLAQCREYLHMISNSSVFSVSAKEAKHLAETGERWFCKKCKQPNPVSISKCRSCGQYYK